MERIKSFNDATSRQAVIASLIMKVLEMASIGPREAIPVLYLLADEAIKVGVNGGHITTDDVTSFDTFGSISENGVSLN